MGSDDNLYGGTYNGGDFGFGTVFQITPGGIVTVLHGTAISPTAFTVN